MARKRISVTSENTKGGNEKFHDNYTGEDMTRKEFVGKIKNGEYANYHIRKINGRETPVSNPDKSEKNNLG
ncbi:conserved hypothetical protein [Rippkaea orientalis PCC 8801]|uniref:DUF3892 domain-containing protein n=1 Tax=Rippkaea orientalis (strain PCC 8801 / RF-1) TaxID=41431 RepID=B7JV92_RIPO1|nr:DUF3892 domain-containing protein [Rippkaea orientalis]ACK68225.1 conserved hypothetical protein [Rippkaea orientalis PCC 8801]